MGEVKFIKSERISGHGLVLTFEINGRKFSRCSSSMHDGHAQPLIWKDIEDDSRYPTEEEFNELEGIVKAAFAPEKFKELLQLNY